MNEHPVLTLHQPWASFLIDTAECRCGADTYEVINAYQGDPPPCRCPAIKWIETRSWACPPGLVGKRLEIHAGAKAPAPRSEWPEDKVRVGEWRIDWCTDDDRFEWRAVHERSDDGLHDKMIPLPLGAILGSVKIEACVPMRLHGLHPKSWTKRGMVILSDDGSQGSYYRPGIEPGELSVDITGQIPLGWFEPGRWAWILSEARRHLVPIQARGRQRVWWRRG